MYFHLDVVSAECKIFYNKVQKISIHGIEGELGIYPNHAQLLTSIKPGVLYIKNINNQEEYIYLSGGILEVQPNIVTILADIAIDSKDINRINALNQKNQAEEYIKKCDLNDSKRKDMLHTLSKALAQIKTIEMMKKIKK
ncbi:F0F1 ATP synthase subunit epsilon [Buchnera aphidicola (Thelaxes californica)]|uniref:ATP synthase epsilon chain n=1 Tax=Buchnera aphidicola (Thelaxes californica) TaxID=1315998 RepID=A0A4D6Y9X8_9GAMM|nr:F0F1 ATP synthase subunit epsilon [Buchnera aphidicola]QCI26567.1 F0F1 ATP synthase subunit epsilon [Buchnera aphidicola (Thelaxes californica)]